MASVTASRTLMAVRPHVPLIKFSCRKGADVTIGAVQASIAVSSAPSDSKPVGTTPRGSGIHSSQLPSRYNRLPLSLEEMECIDRGGPA